MTSEYAENAVRALKKGMLERYLLIVLGVSILDLGRILTIASDAVNREVFRYTVNIDKVIFYENP